MTVYSKKNKPKKNNAGLYGGLLAVFVLAYIVQRDVSLPKVVIVGGAMFAFMVLFAKSLKSPIPAILAIVCYVPFSKVLVGDFGGLVKAFNFTNVLMVLVMMGMLAQAGRTGRKLFERNSLNIPCLLFCLITCVSFVKGSIYFGHYGDFMELLSQAKRWLTPVFLFFLAYNALVKENDIRSIIKIVMIVVLIVGMMATWDYMNVGNVSHLEKARIGGIADQPNQLAAFFVYYMFLYAGFFLTYMPSFRAFLLLVPLMIIFRGIMVTFSRGGYLAFTFGGLGISFFKNKVFFILVTMGLVFLILNPQFLPRGIRYRMGQTFTQSDDYYDESYTEDNLEKSAGNRVEIWKTAVYMIKDKPLLGFGYGTFPKVLARYNPGLGTWDAHNSYIIMAAEMGIPALIVFLWIVFVVFLESRWLAKHAQDKFFRATGLGMVGGIFGLLMANMFGSRLGSLEISGYFWILAAVVLRMKQIEMQKRREQAHARQSKKRLS